MAGQIYRALSRGRESYNKIKNNIISKYLGDGLSDLNSTNPELDGVSGLKKDTSKDSGYDKNLGQPKQDLNKQPVPEYQAPTAGGFGALGDGVKQFTDGLKNQQTTQETTQPPVTDNGVGTYESNLKAKNDAIKKQNEDYMKKYIDFYNKASKFGELGQKFQTDATNLLQYKIKKSETTPEYDTKNMQTDADGYAFEMKWNGKNFVKVPVNGADGKPLRMKSDDFEKDKFKQEMDLKKQQLEHKITYDDAILEIKQMQEDRKNNGKTGNGGNGNGKSKGDGTTTTNGENGEQVVVDENTGKEVKLEFREDPILDELTGLPTNKTTKKWYIAGTNQPAGDLLTGMQNLKSKNKRVVEGQKEKYKAKNMVVEDKGKRKQIKDKVQGTIGAMLDKMSPADRDAWLSKYGSLLQK